MLRSRQPLRTDWDPAMIQYAAVDRTWTNGGESPQLSQGVDELMKGGSEGGTGVPAGQSTTPRDCAMRTASCRSLTPVLR